MGTNVVRKWYRCFNDCDWAGCPGHEMTASYQRSSDTFRLVWHEERGTAREFVMDVNEMEAMRDLIAALGDVTTMVGEYRPRSSAVRRILTAAYIRYKREQEEQA